MQTVLITGGTGMIGRHLTAMLLQKGYAVIILTRNASKYQTDNPFITYASWNVANQSIDHAAISKADYIIHLAGAGVADKRWTEQRKQEIINSRIQSSQLLVKELSENNHQIKAVVSASAIGWYGPDTPESLQQGFNENNQAYSDFLGSTCKAWEESIEPVIHQNIRLVKLRTGIVLSNNGGALTEFKKPLAAGIAAILGNGDQIISWIHIDDLCRQFIYALENNHVIGLYNAVAPNPVSNKTLTLILAKKMRGKFFIPIHVPSFILKILLGEMSIEVLKSATVSSAKIKEAGFIFLFPSIQAALEELVN